MIAVGATAFFLFKRKGTAAPPAAAEEDDDNDNDEGAAVDEDAGTITLPEVPIGPPPSARVPVSIPPDIVPRIPVIAPAPAPPVSAPTPLPPLEVDELEPSAPPFVPDEVRNPRAPSIVPGIPDLVTLPPQSGRPIEIPAGPPRGPVVVAPPPIPPRAPAPSPAPPEVPQDDVPDDTAELVQLMLEEEARTGWKRELPELAEWLAARGEPESTKFGPGSAALMAEEIGTLPIVRFWPAASGTNPRKALDEYRAKLRAIAEEKDEPHRSQLLSAAQREKGQSFGPPQGDGGRSPITPTISLEVIS